MVSVHTTFELPSVVQNDAASDHEIIVRQAKRALWAKTAKKYECAGVALSCGSLRTYTMGDTVPSGFRRFHKAHRIDGLPCPGSNGR